MVRDTQHALLKYVYPFFNKRFRTFRASCAINNAFVKILKNLFFLLLLVLLFFYFPLLYSGPIPLSLQMIAKKAEEEEGMKKRRFIAWEHIIINYQNKAVPEKLGVVNDFINQFEFQKDIEYTGASDYWKTPIEFVKDGGGDCEDFAIAKYFTLLIMKVPIETLRITYVKASRFNRAHMVLAYYPTAASEPLILDNLNPKILPSSKRPDLIPIYSFNGENLWLAKKGTEESIGNSSQLSKWKAVLERMEKKE